MESVSSPVGGSNFPLKRSREQNINISVYIDGDLEAWERSTKGTPPLPQQVGEDEGQDALLMFKSTQRFWQEVDDFDGTIRNQMPVLLFSAGI